MRITDIDLTNAIAIAQLTTVLLVIAFMLVFFVSIQIDKNLKSKRKT